MSNALLHKIKVVDAETVETIQQLRDAIDGIADLGGDIQLSQSYRVELLSETLSDGSVACKIRIRLAESV